MKNSTSLNALPLSPYPICVDGELTDSRMRLGGSQMRRMKVWMVGSTVAVTLTLAGMLGCGSSGTGSPGSSGAPAGSSPAADPAASSPAAGSPPAASPPAKPVLTLKGGAQ